MFHIHWFSHKGASQSTYTRRTHTQPESKFISGKTKQERMNSPILLSAAEVPSRTRHNDIMPSYTRHLSPGATSAGRRGAPLTDGALVQGAQKGSHEGAYHSTSTRQLNMSTCAYNDHESSHAENAIKDYRVCEEIHSTHTTFQNPSHAGGDFLRAIRPRPSVTDYGPCEETLATLTPTTHQPLLRRSTNFRSRQDIMSCARFKRQLTGVLFYFFATTLFMQVAQATEDEYDDEWIKYTNETSEMLHLWLKECVFPGTWNDKAESLKWKLPGIFIPRDLIHCLSADEISLDEGWFGETALKCLNRHYVKELKENEDNVTCKLVVHGVRNIYNSDRIVNSADAALKQIKLTGLKASGGYYGPGVYTDLRVAATTWTYGYSCGTCFNCTDGVCTSGCGLFSTVSSCTECGGKGHGKYYADGRRCNDTGRCNRQCKKKEHVPGSGNGVVRFVIGAMFKQDKMERKDRYGYDNFRQGEYWPGEFKKDMYFPEDGRRWAKANEKGIVPLWIGEVPATEYKRICEEHWPDLNVYIEEKQARVKIDGGGTPNTMGHSKYREKDSKLPGGFSIGQEVVFIVDDDSVGCGAIGTVAGRAENRQRSKTHVSCEFDAGVWDFRVSSICCICCQLKLPRGFVIGQKVVFKGDDDDDVAHNEEGTVVRWAEDDDRSKTHVSCKFENGVWDFYVSSLARPRPKVLG